MRPPPLTHGRWYAWQSVILAVGGVVALYAFVSLQIDQPHGYAWTQVWVIGAWVGLWIGLGWLTRDDPR